MAPTSSKKGHAGPLAAELSGEHQHQGTQAAGKEECRRTRHYPYPWSSSDQGGRRSGMHSRQRHVNIEGTHTGYCLLPNAH